MRIRRCEYRDCSRLMIYLSRHIYVETVDGDGGAVQSAGRRDAAADSGAAADGRGLRLRHPREPEGAAAEGVEPPGVSPPLRTRGDAARRTLGPLPARAIS